MHDIGARAEVALQRELDRWREERDRAAHLRTKDDKLMALESDSRTRAYVVHRDSLIVAKDGDKTRALLSMDEALKAGANPGTIFLGLARWRRGVRHGHLAAGRREARRPQRRRSG